MEYPLIAYCCYEGVYILNKIILNGEQIGAIISGVTGKTGEDFDALNESAYDAIYGVVNDSDFLLKDKVLEVLEDHSGRNETGWSGTLSAKAGGDCLSGWLADWLRPGVDANGG